MKLTMMNDNILVRLLGSSASTTTDSGIDVSVNDKSALIEVAEIVESSTVGYEVGKSVFIPKDCGKNLMLKGIMYVVIKTTEVIAVGEIGE